MEMTMKALIDLTHSFDHSMPVYPGDDCPEITQIARIAEDEYNEFCFRGGMHVGTHIDAPLHMVADGQPVSAIPVSRFFGRGRLIDARGSSEISVDLLKGARVERGDIIVVLTGWHERFRKADYFADHPLVTPAFAEELIRKEVSILALDTPTPDRHPFPIHKMLLGNGVLIIENLANVSSLVDHPSFEIVALPAKYQWDGAPVRVVAKPSP
ncbi:cyclase family protein [Brevundimonas sp. 2R-24]|uniref:Cyclase family protein n=1 Tax=Peiella sedimenti TaxID=3061083 RepID=A0ABT8SNF4_9CAUL|nr:cyclase family protein [Caulobacteraceae bacterium XZ-24]